MRLRWIAGFALMLTAASTAFASGVDPVIRVPEIDPGTMGSALALLTGGYLVVVSRFRRK